MLTTDMSFYGFSAGQSRASNRPESASEKVKVKRPEEKIEHIRKILHDPSVNLDSLTVCGDCASTMKRESQKLLAQLHFALNQQKNFYEEIAAKNKRSKLPKSPVRGVKADNTELQKAISEHNQLIKRDQSLSQTINGYQTEISDLLVREAAFNNKVNGLMEVEEELEEELRIANAVLHELLIFGGVSDKILSSEKASSSTNLDSSDRGEVYKHRKVSILAPLFDNIEIHRDWSEVNGLRLRCQSLPAIQLNWGEINRAWSVTTSLLQCLRRTMHLSEVISMQNLQSLRRALIDKCGPVTAPPTSSAPTSLATSTVNALANTANFAFALTASQFLSPQASPAKPLADTSPPTQGSMSFDWNLRFISLHDRALILLQIGAQTPPSQPTSASPGRPANLAAPSHSANVTSSSSNTTDRIPANSPMPTRSQAGTSWPVPVRSGSPAIHTVAGSGVRPSTATPPPSSAASSSVSSSTLCLEGGVITYASANAPTTLLSLYQRGIIGFCVAVCITAVEMAGPNLLRSTHISSFALWELLTCTLLGKYVGFEEAIVSLPTSSTVPSNDEINEALAYATVPRQECDVVDRLQQVTTFHRKHALPAVIWKVMRDPGYLDCVVHASMRLLRDLTEDPCGIMAMTAPR